VRFPPLLMRIRISNERHHINLWLPLFLVWLILGAIMLALSPIVAVLVLIFQNFGWGEFLLMLGPVIYDFICALRELKIDVDRKNERMVVYFI